MERILENLFGSPAKVKLLRLFLQNTERAFTFDEIIKSSRTPRRTARAELGKLIKIGVIAEKTASLREETENRSDKRTKKIKVKKTKVFYANPKFWFLNELHRLVTKPSADLKQRLILKLKRLGNVKLAIISGIFLSNENTRTDLLIVGDKIKKSKLEHFLADVESEIGKSIRYTFMDTPEFKYRLDMYDRFLRDIIEYPHEKLINRVNI